MNDEIISVRVNKNLKEKMRIYNEDYWNNFARKVISKTLRDIEKIKKRGEKLN